MRIKKLIFAMVLSAATLFAPTVFCEMPESQPRKNLLDFGFSGEIQRCCFKPF